MNNLQRLFELSGNENDSLVFLKNFKSTNSEKFALIYLSPNTILDSFSYFLFELGLLYSLDLFPCILITKDSKEYIEVFFKQKLNEENQILSKFIEYKKEIKEEIKNLIQNKIIPIVYVDEKNIFEDSVEIISSVEINKFIYLDLEAPFRNEITKKKISLISLNSNETELNLSTQNLSFFENIQLLFNKVQHQNFNFVYASPLSLIKELFTINGSGTFIKFGSKIDILKNLKNVDFNKLKELLENSFKRKVKDKFFDKNISTLIIEKNYKGAGIFFETIHGYYLSKFAVDEIARGEGVGRDIWNEMKKIMPKIFWRAKTTNPIHKWYLKECDGFLKSNGWNLYWIGLESNQISAAEKYILDLEEDFINEDILL